jgi:polysaccharide export outer membrane protein
MSLTKVLSLMMFMFLTACASVPEETGGNPGDTMAAVQPSVVDPSKALAKEYTIGVDDMVKVSVWKNPDLSVEVPVRPDGMISVPLIGDVEVGGKVPSEVAEIISSKLSEYVREPQVTVILSKLNSHEFISRIRVTGAVDKANSMPYRQGMTVLDAVLEAGGVNKFASPNGTKLYRKVDGKSVLLPVKLGNILKKGDLETNYPLLPGDVITVPERGF